MFAHASHRNSFFSLRAVLVYFVTAIVLASALVVSGESPARAAVCTSGVAPSGNGASNNPYLIATAANLIWMSEQTANWNNQHFRQTASIDLGGCQFTPIGKNTTAHFKGTYDGRGFTIEGLYIRGTSDYSGLFGDTNETAVFRNIGLVDVDIESTHGSVGALVGRLTGGNARVFNSYSTGRIAGSTFTGGLVGVLWAGGSITNSWSTSSVTIRNINGQGGGLAGSVITSGTVTNVYAAGPVSAATGVTSTALGALIGGTFTGSSTRPTETAAFFDSDVSALSNGIGTGRSTAQMKTRATFSPAWAIVDGWEAFNFSEPGGTNYWGICSLANNGYPFLLGAYTADPCVALASAPSITSVTPASSSGSLSVAFTAPTSDGNLAITNYKYSIDNGATWVTRSPIATTSPLVIQGLTNGTSYQIKLLAINSLGDGSASIAVSGTPLTTSSAPTITSITASSGSLSVAFTAPGSNGGAAISNYKYSLDNGVTWITRSAASTSSPLVITGLTNGTSYQVKLLAVNSQGDGAASSTVSGTPVAPPPTSSAAPATSPASLTAPAATLAVTGSDLLGAWGFVAAALFIGLALLLVSGFRRREPGAK